MTDSSFPGTYHFQKQELVAAFRFQENGHFDFFYSYGAADRSATGTYTIEGDLVKLKSDKEPGNDFTILKKEKRGAGIAIKISDPNPYLAGYVHAIYFVDGSQQLAECNSRQEIIIPDPAVEKIYLQHQLFPDIPSLIRDEAEDADYFEVALCRSLEQVSFKGIDLTITGEGLTCLPNYLLPATGCLFRKKGG